MQLVAGPRIYYAVFLLNDMQSQADSFRVDGLSNSFMLFFLVARLC